MRNTNRYHRPAGETEEEFTAFLLDDLEHTIEAAGPETVAMVIMEPVQNAGGAFTPPAGYWRGVREICDRYDILLCADEVITGFGRLGAWFGSERYDIRPDLITMREGPLLVVRVDRRGDRDRPRDGAVHATDRACTRTGSRSAAIRCRRRSRSKNIEIMKRERIVEHVADDAGRLPRDARAAARPADRRRPPRHRLLLRARARQGQGDARRASTTRSARRCCAASSRRGCSSAG